MAERPALGRMTTALLTSFVIGTRHLFEGNPRRASPTFQIGGQDSSLRKLPEKCDYTYVRSVQVRKRLPSMEVSR